MPRVALNMPKMSMTMEEGTVVEWQVAEGDQVTSGDVVAIVTTDKVDMEVEATSTGTLLQILHASGAIVPVGEPIALIDSEQEDLLGDLFSTSPGDAPLAGTQEQGHGDSAAAAETSRQGQEPTDSRVIAAPLARKLAREAGIDLATVRATSESGIIRARDVRDAIAARRSVGPAEPSATSQLRSVPSAGGATAGVGRTSGEILGDARSRRLRAATASLMTASAAIPQFTVERSLDLSVMTRARRAALQGVGWTTILIRAYAMMLRAFPLLGGAFTPDGVRANPHVGVALAVDTPQGLLAPVLQAPDQVSLRELDEAVRVLVDRARSGSLDLDAMQGATGTLSSLGGRGVRRFNALLTPPQATALSVGSIGARVDVDESGSFVAMMQCDVGLTVDHRAADGADAARGLQHIQDLLSDPLSLAL